MDIEQIIKTLREGQSMQTEAWALVLRCARQYAQVKLHGSYIENGRCILLGKRDQESYQSMFRENLLREVERAFLEDALMGQALQEQLGGQL